MATDDDGFERGLSEEEMIEQFSYDPFAKENTPEEPTVEETAPPIETQEPAAKESADAGVVAPGPAPVISAPEPVERAVPAAPSASEIELAALKSTIVEMQRRLDSQVVAAPPAPVPAAPADEIPAYEYGMPKELVDGLASEDAQERGAALSFLVKATSRMIHKTVIEQMRKEMAELPERITSDVERQTQARASREAIRQDFFQTFPMLAKPELQPLVQSLTATVMAETGITEWNQTLRDAIGARAYSVLGAVMPQQRGPIQAAPVQPTRVVPAPPPTSFAGNTRPAGAGRASVDDVWDTLFG